MTVVSCVVVALAFVIAVLLLVFAGALIGWNLPRLIAAVRGRGSSDGGSR